MEKLQWIQNKILTPKNLLHKCNALRAEGKKIVFTNGCFDILHQGHLVYLAQAASLGGALIVGLNTDASVQRLKGTERPINHETDRALQLASLLVVDAVCFFDENTPENLIQLIKPDILVKGGDYTESQIAGADFVKQSGGIVTTIPFVEGYSTSNLISKIRSL